MRQGRPIVFLAQVLVGWVMLRAAMTWLPMEDAPPEQQRAARPAPVAPANPAAPAVPAMAGHHGALTAHAALMSISSASLMRSSVPMQGIASVLPGTGPEQGAVPDALLDSALAFAQQKQVMPRLLLAGMAPGRARVALLPETGLAAQPSSTIMPGTATPGVSPPASSPWSGSAWLLVRASGAVGAGPMLGGSQAGLRLDRALAMPALPGLRAYGRLSGPVRMPVGEGAIGLSARPLASLPVTLALEARQRLASGGRSGAALYAAGGIGPRATSLGLEVEGYAQAGLVGLPGMDGFADGRLALGRRIAGKPGAADLRLALNAEGAAQPGASRIDIGPQLDARLPLPTRLGSQPVMLRFSGGWRERVAGAALPGSGPALVLVASF